MDGEALGHIHKTVPLPIPEEVELSGVCKELRSGQSWTVRMPSTALTLYETEPAGSRIEASNLLDKELAEATVFTSNSRTSIKALGARRTIWRSRGRGCS
jgi:hypothetical protein